MINISQEDVDFIMQEIQKNKLQKISKIFDFFTNFQGEKCFESKLATRMFSGIFIPLLGF